MAIDSAKLDALQLRAAAGEKLAVCEILTVYWNDSTTKYYADKKYHELTNFSQISLKPIENKLVKKDNFLKFKLNGDLTDSAFNIEFIDFDDEIKDLFIANKTVKCTVSYYYPQEDLLVADIWWGRLSPPNDLSTKYLTAKASNGFLLAALQMPRRKRPFNCPSIFGGKLKTTEQLKTNGCGYDKHLGGSVGINDSSTGLPYEDCPGRNKSDCNARMGTTDGKHFMGYEADTSAIVGDPDSGFISHSRGNLSKLKKPIRVIAGSKTVRDLQLLFWRRRPNTSHPDTGWLDTIWEIGEGPVQAVFNTKINGVLRTGNYSSVKLGNRAQSRTTYSPSIHNFSLTSIMFLQWGHVNPADFSPGNISAECKVLGYSKVRHFTDETTYTENYSISRVWWLLELYTNMRFGRGYDHSVFDIQSFIDTNDWAHSIAQFTDDYGNTYPHYRTQFNAILEGKSTQEQITEICRSGRISIPFQHEGKYHIVPLAKGEGKELTEPKTFSDAPGGNIQRKPNGLSTLTVSTIPDDQLVNTVNLTFEDRAKEDIERPLTIFDPNQQARAGEALGKGGFEEIPKQYLGYGVTHENEARKLGASLLWFGEFDRGGIKNNCGGTFICDLVDFYGIKKYEIIKIESDKLIGHKAPDDIQFTLFRVIDAEKLANNLVMVKYQAYNEAAYEQLDSTTVIVPTGGGGGVDTGGGRGRGGIFGEDGGPGGTDGPVIELPTNSLTIGAASYTDNEFTIRLDD